MTLFKKMISGMFSHPSWAGIGVMVAIVSLVSSIDFHWRDDLEIINYRVEKKGIYFSVRNNLDKSVIVNNAILNLKTVTSNKKCYTAIPVKYTVDLKTKNNKFKVSGLLTRENSIDLDLNQIIRSKSIELFIFEFYNFFTVNNNNCNEDFLLIDITLYYDNEMLKLKGKKIKL